MEYQLESFEEETQVKKERLNLENQHKLQTLIAEVDTLNEQKNSAFKMNTRLEEELK
jgi:hypothetical protein